MRTARLLAASVAALMYAGTASAGVFILDGTDSDDHGSASATANLAGWLYIQKALENIAASPDLTLDDAPSANIIAVLGASSTAASAATSAHGKSSLSGTYSLAFITDIAGFFANTNVAGQNSTDASILYIPSDGVTGGTSSTESAALTANATGINNFLGAGGGLFSMGHSYGWLTALIPGAAAVPPGSGSDLTLTAAGTANFPGLTSADLSTGPWHYHFTGFGGIPVLATGIIGTAVVPVIIGGSGGTITAPPTSGVPEPATWAMMLMGFGFIGGAMRYSRRKQATRFSAA